MIRPLLAVMLVSTSLIGQSPAGSCPALSPIAQPFGPPATPADSARLYTSLVSSDGSEFWFFRKAGPLRSEDYRIFRSRRQGAGWSSPEQVRLGIDASDLYPSLSADGSRLVFSSYRPVPGDTSERPNAHLYLSHREGDGWSEPELLGASRIGHYHSGVVQEEDGSLWFKLTTPDWRDTRPMRLAWNGRTFADAMTAATPDPALAYWRARQGDSLFVWDAVAGPVDFTLLAVSRVLPNGRRAPSTFFHTSPRPDGSYSPLLPARGIPGTAPNFAWFSTDGCWLHFTRDYSEFMRVPVAALR